MSGNANRSKLTVEVFNHYISDKTAATLCAYISLSFATVHCT